MSAKKQDLLEEFDNVRFDEDEIKSVLKISEFETVEILSKHRADWGSAILLQPQVLRSLIVEIDPEAIPNTRISPGKQLDEIFEKTVDRRHLVETVKVLSRLLDSPISPLTSHRDATGRSFESLPDVLEPSLFGTTVALQSPALAWAVQTVLKCLIIAAVISGEPVQDFPERITSLKADLQAKLTQMFVAFRPLKEAGWEAGSMSASLSQVIRTESHDVNRDVGREGGDHDTHHLGQPRSRLESGGLDSSVSSRGVQDRQSMLIQLEACKEELAQVKTQLAHANDATAAALAAGPASSRGAERAIEAAEREIAALKQELERTKRESREAIKRKDEEITVLQSDLAEQSQFREQLAHSEVQLDRYKKEIQRLPDLERRLAELDGQLAERDGTIAALEASALGGAENKQQIEEIKAALREKDSSISELTEKVNLLNTELTDTKRTLQNIERDRVRLEKELEAQSVPLEGLEPLQATSVPVDTQLASIKQDAAQYRKKYEIALAEKDALGVINEDLSRQLQLSKSNYTALEKTLRDREGDKSGDYFSKWQSAENQRALLEAEKRTLEDIIREKIADSNFKESNMHRVIYNLSAQMRVLTMSNEAAEILKLA